MSGFDRKKPVKRVKKRTTVGFDGKSDDIKMSPHTGMHKEAGRTSEERPRKAYRSPMKIIQGGAAREKKERKRYRISVCIAVVLVVTLIALQIFSPTGIVESTQNFFASMGGGGGYPVSISGVKINNIYYQSGKIFALTDTSYYVYNSRGKEIVEYQHGYLNPVLSTSEARTLVYDRGGNGIRVDLLDRNLLDTNLKNNIVSADICRSGRIAVATEANDYVAQLTVYSKAFESIFRWSSSEQQISCVALSNNGKKVAAVTVSSKNGSFNSTVHIFDVSTAEKIATVEFAGELIVSLENKDDNMLCVSSGDMISVFDWEGGNKKTVNMGEIKYLDNRIDDLTTVVYTKNNNTQQSCIGVYDTDGTIIYEIEIPLDISMAAANKNKVYAISSNTLYCYDSAGNLVGSEVIGYEFLHIVPYKGGAAVSADMTVSRYKF